jgi:hypothetical protein
MENAKALETMSFCVIWRLEKLEEKKRPRVSRLYLPHSPRWKSFSFLLPSSFPNNIC